MSHGQWVYLLMMFIHITTYNGVLLVGPWLCFATIAVAISRPQSLVARTSGSIPGGASAYSACTKLRIQMHSNTHYCTHIFSVQVSVWCIKSFISSFAPKTASLNSLRHDSVVLWTQARSLVIKSVVKLLLNFGFLISGTQ